MEPFFRFRSRPRDILAQASRGISAARRLGHHTYYGDLHFELEAGTEQIASSLIAWCREVIGSCRRPFGIDYFDLSITVRPAQDGRPHMLSLKELRPGSLYATTLEDRVAEFIDRRFPSQGRYPLRISTALFSWGDAAHEALPSTW